MIEEIHFATIGQAINYLQKELFPTVREVIYIAVKKQQEGGWDLKIEFEEPKND